MTFLAVVTGEEAVRAICLTARAIVQLSVPWSGPERKVRALFAEAMDRIADRLPQVTIAGFRLEIDEDLASQDWIISLGYLEFIPMGAGSILWLEYGSVVSVAATPCGSRVQDLVDRTHGLWRQ